MTIITFLGFRRKTIHRSLAHHARSVSFCALWRWMILFLIIQWWSNSFYGWRHHMMLELKCRCELDYGGCYRSLVRSFKSSRGNGCWESCDCARVVLRGRCDSSLTWWSSRQSSWEGGWSCPPSGWPHGEVNVAVGWSQVTGWTNAYSYMHWTIL